MYLRAIGRRFTQIKAYFLVMNSKRCKAGNLQSPPAGDTINGPLGEMAREAYKEQMERRDS